MPKKTKKEQLQEEAREIITDYMKKQNRPYNIVMLIQNLHGAVKRADGQRALDALVEDGEVFCKEFGKAKLYWWDQRQFDDISEDELADLDASIKAVKDELAETQAELSSAASSRRHLEAQLTDEQLQARIAELSKDNERMSTKLAGLKSEGMKLVTPAEKKKVEERLSKAVTAWRQRKRMCWDVLDQVCEGMGKKPSQLKNDLGLEFDEEFGVGLDGREVKRARKNGE